MFVLFDIIIYLHQKIKIREPSRGELMLEKKNQPNPIKIEEPQKKKKNK
jgi:hypothetical protein